MRSIGRQVTQEHVLFFPALPPLSDVNAGMETVVVEHYDGQLVCRSVTGEFVDEGDYMGAFDAFLDQLEVQDAFLLTPSERANQVEPAVASPPCRDTQAVFCSPLRPGVTDR